MVLRGERCCVRDLNAIGGAHPVEFVREFREREDFSVFRIDGCMY